MGVEREPAPARLEHLWGTLGTVRGRWETGWSPGMGAWTQAGGGLGNMRGPALEARCGAASVLAAGTGSQMCAEEMTPDQLPSPPWLPGSLRFWPEQQKTQSQRQLPERSEGQASPAPLLALPALSRIRHFSPSGEGLSVRTEASLFWGLSCWKSQPY